MSWSIFGAFLVVNFLAASSGAIFKPGPWYKDLNKPTWTPPNWAFPVVWSVLFALNALAGAIAWRASAGTDPGAFAVYAISLMFNAGWSALFFGAKRMDLALADLVALWLSIAVTIGLFAVHSPLAAALIVPYLVWVTIAGALNVRMLQMNPSQEYGAKPLGADGRD